MRSARDTNVGILWAVHRASPVALSSHEEDEMSHVEITDHEHLPQDGCQTVQHDDHVDHVHDGENHREVSVHANHEGTHTPDDGCETVQHDDHVDHIHDGHRHVQHGDHVHEH